LNKKIDANQILERGGATGDLLERWNKVRETNSRFFHKLQINPLTTRSPILFIAAQLMLDWQYTALFPKSLAFLIISGGKIINTLGTKKKEKNLSLNTVRL